MTEYTGNDIYCDLIIPRKLNIRVIAETKHVIAFHHTRPHWPVHIVVTCKQHVPSLLEVNNSLAKEILDTIKTVAKQVRDTTGACRVVTNLGGYQDSKHLHVHVASGESLAKT